MSADGDIVRAGMREHDLTAGATAIDAEHDPACRHCAALAALDRLEAAEENCCEAETNYMREFARANAAEAQRDALLGAVEAAMSELGVPGPDYPAPVANAYETLRLIHVAVRAALAEAGLE